jgi:septum site-determining protein MinC
MENQNVVFKGTKNGVIVMVNGSGSFEVIKQEIENKLCKSDGFFKNGKIYIDFSDANIDENHQEEIKRLIFQNYGISIQNVDRNKVRMFNGIYEGRTKFVQNTVRSGQSIEYAGNIVIIGDVNAGGQVSAGGNIIVMGVLRGMVHAGTSGNENAVIAAFSLQPTQLRIAGVITRSPDGDVPKPKCPELARIKDGCIIIEPYAPNKML